MLVDGVDVAAWPAHRVARLGVIRTFQHTSEFARLTVLENLLVAAPGQSGDSLGGALLGRGHARPGQLELLARAWDLLADFGLTALADSYAGQLSRSADATLRSIRRTGWWSAGEWQAAPPCRRGTRLHLSHRDLPGDQATLHATGWKHFLDRLTTAAAGADPGPDPWDSTR